MNGKDARIEIYFVISTTHLTSYVARVEREPWDMCWPTAGAIAFAVLLCFQKAETSVDVYTTMQHMRVEKAGVKTGKDRKVERMLQSPCEFDSTYSAAVLSLNTAKYAVWSC